MNMKKKKDGSTLTICISGRIDTATSPEVGSYVNDNLDGITRLILDFKDGRNYAKSWAAKAMAEALRCLDLSDVYLVGIPAASRYSHTRRYKRFISLLCHLTGARNGYEMISVCGARGRVHIDGRSEGLLHNVRFADCISGKRVIVIDDICTTGTTADYFIDCLKSAGADVCMALFLAKTKSYRTS